MTQHKFRISLYLATAFPITAIVILAVALAFQVTALKTAHQAVDQTNQAISADRELLKLTVDMETGLRGFQYTGRTEFLQPYL